MKLWLFRLIVVLFSSLKGLYEVAEYNYSLPRKQKNKLNLIYILHFSKTTVNSYLFRLYTGKRYLK